MATPSYILCSAVVTIRSTAWGRQMSHEHMETLSGVAWTDPWVDLVICMAWPNHWLSCTSFAPPYLKRDCAADTNDITPGSTVCQIMY